MPAEACPVANRYGDCVDAANTPEMNLGANCRTACCEPCDWPDGADRCCASCLSDEWRRRRSCLAHVHAPCIANGERVQLMGEWGRWKLRKTREDGSPWGQQTVPSDSNCNFNAVPAAGCKKGNGERWCMPILNTFGTRDAVLWAAYLAYTAAGAEWAGYRVPRDCSGCRCQGLTCDECDCVFEAESSSSTTPNSPASAIGISLIENE